MDHTQDANNYASQALSTPTPEQIEMTRKKIQIAQYSVLEKHCDGMISMLLNQRESYKKQIKDLSQEVELYIQGQLKLEVDHGS